MCERGRRTRIIHIRRIRLWRSREHENNTHENHIKHCDERTWESPDTERKRARLKLVCAHIPRANRNNIRNILAHNANREYRADSGGAGECEASQEDGEEGGEPDCVDGCFGVGVHSVEVL